MKSNGDEASLESLYNANEESIKIINQNNKAKLDEEIAKQEDINIKNFFTEQKINEKVQETLDRVNSIMEKAPTSEQIIDEEKNEDKYILKEQNDMDNLEFDASKDIVDSSDDLQENLDAEFDIEFDEVIVNELEPKKDNIIKESEKEKGL